MSHQNTTSSNATAQNAVSDPAAPGDHADQAQSEPRSYASSDVADSTLAPPAAGEMPDGMDDGDALGASDIQQGASNGNRPDRTERQFDQGPKTLVANRERLKGD